MTSIEEKSLKTQLKLLEEIKECDLMILHYVRWEVSKSLEEVFESSKNRTEESIEISLESYKKLVKLLNNIGIHSKTFKNLDNGLAIHQEKKEMKLEIYNSLS